MVTEFWVGKMQVQKWVSKQREKKQVLNLQLAVPWDTSLSAMVMIHYPTTVHVSCLFSYFKITLLPLQQQRPSIVICNIIISLHFDPTSLILLSVENKIHYIKPLQSGIVGMVGFILVFIKHECVSRSYR